MTSEKFSRIRKSCKLHELRYFQEIHALSENIEDLWMMKCQFIVDDYFEDSSALKIYFNGNEEWLFDYVPTKQEASRCLANEILNPFALAKLARMFGIKGSKEVLLNKRLENA